MKYISGAYTQGQLKKTIDEIEIALTEEFKEHGAIVSLFDQRMWRDRVIEASFGRNTVKFDDQGNPSVMVIFPHNNEMMDGSTALRSHPAFIVNGKLISEIYISKYLNIVPAPPGPDARALSLKGCIARRSYSFDAARTVCSNKGPGWHLMTNAEFSAVVLDCWNKGFFPRGNTYYGKSDTVPSERGTPAHASGISGAVYGTLTGSGPVTWAHDGTPYGIADLKGNLFERVSGLQLDDRTINVIPNNDAAASGADLGIDSALWKVILQDGTLADIGTSGALGYVEVGGGITVKENVTGLDHTHNQLFSGMLPSSGITIPAIMKQLILYPKSTDLPGNDQGRFNFYGLGKNGVSRSGHWDSGGLTSLTSLATTLAAAEPIGLRSVYIEGV